MIIRRTALICLVFMIASACAFCDGLYDIDATRTDIRYVLEALARQSGANIVVSPDITGEVTAHLKQMPLDAILDHLSKVSGFGWAQNGDAYLVASKEKLTPPQPAETKQEVQAPPPQQDVLIWRCRHIKASDLARVITSIFPNFKAVAGPAPSSPVLDESSQSSTTISSGSSDTSTGSASQSNSNSGNTDQATTVVLYGNSDELAKAKALLEKLDVRRQQISIDVSIAEISSTHNKELGINWSWNDIVLKEAQPESGIHFGKLTRDASTFTGTLSALIENGGGNLLAQPNISVLDGQNAEILIGDKILFPKLTGYSQVGTPIYDKEEERVGINLQIAPRIADDDEIILTLYPQVSLVTSYLKTQAGDYPQISTREARTTVSVKNGATLAIGGLLKNNDVVNASKIPLLGDLPIIGQFFRHSKTTKEKTEIIILLTPKIIDEVGEQGKQGS